jgi:hypothetical protein
MTERRGWVFGVLGARGASRSRVRGSVGAGSEGRRGPEGGRTVGRVGLDQRRQSKIGDGSRERIDRPLATAVFDFDLRLRTSPSWSPKVCTLRKQPL